MNFHKKFSVGLPVINTVDEFDAFLAEYSQYIENFYFSVPLGDKFHSREVTKRVLRESDKKDYFSALLHTVKKYGINLELLFNTYGLSKSDLLHAYDYMQSIGMEPDEIGFIEPYYEWVKELYPGKRYVYSFNNFPNSCSDYFKNEYKYEQYVVGRKFIRDQELKDQIHKLNASVVLLVNNGCSFTCGGCGRPNHCHDAYYDERVYRSYEYMYAVQSIMPFEIHEGLIPLENIDYIKIASRNAGVEYIRRCMNSYILNTNEPQYEEDYLLWSRLAWHTDYFKYLDYREVISIKRELYTDNDFCRKNLLEAKPFEFELDFTDYLIELSQDDIKAAVGGMFKDEQEKLRDKIEKLITNSFEQLGIRKNAPFVLKRIYLGTQSCAKLLRFYDSDILKTIISTFKRMGYIVAFTFPIIYFSDQSEIERIIDYWRKDDISNSEMPDEIVVNDMATYHFIREKLSVPLAFGRLMGNLSIDSMYNNRDSEDNRRCMTISENTKRMYSDGDIAYIMCDMNRNGIWLDTQNKVPVKVFVSNSVVQANNVCRYDAECNYQCMNQGKNQSMNQKQMRCNLYSAGRLYYKNCEFNPDMISAIKEMRFSLVVSV